MDPPLVGAAFLNPLVSFRDILGSSEPNDFSTHIRLCCAHAWRIPVIFLSLKRKLQFLIFVTLNSPPPSEFLPSPASYSRNAGLPPSPLFAPLFISLPCSQTYIFLTCIAEPYFSVVHICIFQSFSHIRVKQDRQFSHLDFLRQCISPSLSPSTAIPSLYLYTTIRYLTTHYF